MDCSAMTHKGHPCTRSIDSQCTVVYCDQIYRLCRQHFNLAQSGLIAGLDNSRASHLVGRWAIVDNVRINLDTYEEIEQMQFIFDPEGGES